jgi:SAM-dependent methyltransferase
VIILERQRAIKLLLDIFSYHFTDPTDLNILDLGCGDGFITEYLFKSYPHNNFFLIDGSGEMIMKAQARLKNQRMTFIRRSFVSWNPNSTWPVVITILLRRIWAFARKLLTALENGDLERPHLRLSLLIISGLPGNFWPIEFHNFTIK